MIKIKNIIKENKIIMTEAFRAGKLRALSNEFREEMIQTFGHTEQNLVLSGTKLQIKKLKPTLNQRKKVLK
jgi:hypothetical protein